MIERTLNEMSSFSGVFGVIVCDSDGNVVAASPGKIMESTEAAHAGRIVSTVINSLPALGEGVPDEIDVCFENGRFLTKSICQGASLGIICAPSVNISLLKLKIAPAIKAVAKELDGLCQAAAQPKPASQVRQAVEEVLGTRAEKPLGILAAAGESEEKLAAACADVIKFAKLFFGKDKAEELKRRFGLILKRSF